METLTSVLRKARVSHVCELCGRLIEAGETYRYQVNVFDCIYTWKCCVHCDELMKILWHCDPWSFDRDEGFSRDAVGEWEPETIGQLRLKVYWNLKWRKRDGTLREVPVLEDKEK